MNAPKYLTPQEVIARLDNKIVVGTLANWRVRGEGPPFSKIGGRVVYPLDKFEEWERSRIFGSTSEYGARRGGVQ